MFLRAEGISGCFCEIVEVASREGGVLVAAGKVGLPGFRRGCRSYIRFAPRSSAVDTADVRNARDRLDAKLRAVIVAAGKRDNDQTEQSLQSAEDTVSVIEEFLKQ